MNQQKEVYFWEYCPKCAYKDNKEDEEPCNECLYEPWRFDSHKPLMFKEEA